MTSAPAPAAAENGSEAFSGESPKSESALAFVTVSRMSSVTFPDMPLSEALLTTTFSSA